MGTSVPHEIRDNMGYGNQLEAYISNHADVLFPYCLCPDCTDKAIKKLDELKASTRNEQLT